MKKGKIPALYFLLEREGCLARREAASPAKVGRLALGGASMKAPRLCLALLVAGLMVSPAAVLAQRGGGHGGHGGGGRGGSWGGGHAGGYNAPSRSSAAPSHSYAPRPGYVPSYRYATPRIPPSTSLSFLSVPRTTVPAPRAQRGGIAGASGTTLATTNLDSRRFGSVQWGTRFSDAIGRFNRPWLGHHRSWFFGSWNNWWWYPSFWAGL